MSGHAPSSFGPFVSLFPGESLNRHDGHIHVWTRHDVHTHVWTGGESANGEEVEWRAALSAVCPSGTLRAIK